MYDIKELTQKIINKKESKKYYIEDILIYKVIQTLEEYIADNLEPKNKYQKVFIVILQIPKDIKSHNFRLSQLLFQIQRFL